jgi:hypothetical protein
MDVDTTMLRHDRVRDRTAPHVIERIDRATRGAIDEVRAAGPSAVAFRLAELDSEWDIDRALLMFFSVAGSITYQLSRRARWARLLLGVQVAFLGIHATAGWCPPVALLRRMGYRTTKEIHAEREALLQMPRPAAT